MQLEHGTDVSHAHCLEPAEVEQQMVLAANERVAGSCSTSGREQTAPPLLVVQERLRSLPFLAKVGGRAHTM